jgi:hypothetical protein
VDRLAGDDGGHGPVVGVHGHALADELLRVPAADRVGVKEAVLVDEGDQQADLVGVPREHHAQLGPRIHRDNHVAVQVGPHLGGELARVLAHDPLHRLLVAGRTGRFQNLLQELLGG